MTCEIDCVCSLLKEITLNETHDLICFQSQLSYIKINQQ